MSHRRAKLVRKLMRLNGMEITSPKGRKMYKRAKRLKREGKI